MILLDVESRSRADLKRVGGRLYWQHPSSEILCLVWYDTLDGSSGLWRPGEPWPHAANRVLVAHNAHGFDRFACERYGISAARWIDSEDLARKAGLPGSLDALGMRWCNTPKDAAASRYTQSLSSVRRLKSITAAAWAALSPTQKREQGAMPTDVDMQRVVSYCASDVAILVDAWPRLEEWIDRDTDSEALNVIINNRGVAFDSALARCLLANDARNTDAVLADVAREFGVSPADVRAACAPQNFVEITGAENAQAATVATIDHPLARARQALASIARGKLTAGLARVSADGRMRDVLQYYGAHTGRWSSHGMQVHNLPRPSAKYEDLPADTRLPHTISAKGERVVDVDALAEAALAGFACDADDIELLVRATLYAPPGRTLVARDFASIEARATAWAACDDEELAVYADGRDPYKVAATHVYGGDYDAVTKAQRQIGKICVLALGYGGGAAAFERFARGYGVDLSALDVPAIIAAWRGAHRPIVSLWYALERAWRAACRGAGSYGDAGAFRFIADDEGRDEIACVLPSGRLIVYPGARAEGRDLSYQGHRRREHVYGGKLCENAIQAFCRDLLAESLIRADKAGLEIVLHVHDEIVVECDADDAERVAAELERCMTIVPRWACGMPLAVSGWEGTRYRK